MHEFEHQKRRQVFCRFVKREILLSLRKCLKVFQAWNFFSISWVVQQQQQQMPKWMPLPPCDEGWVEAIWSNISWTYLLTALLATFCWFNICSFRDKLFFEFWAKPGLFHVYFRHFLNTMTNISRTKFWPYKSVDGVLGIRTPDGDMVGVDESTELWRPPNGREKRNGRFTFILNSFLSLPIPASFCISICKKLT